MKKSIQNKWWVLLVQGIFMVFLSIVIFRNPDAVLSAVAFWLGIMVIATGLVGIIAYISTPKESRNMFSVIVSSAVLVVGIAIILKLGITMKAITFLFGLLVASYGVVLILGGWKAQTKWTYWWTVVAIGGIALILGIKSIFDVYSGAQTISFIIGASVLLAGIGLIMLSFLKKRIIETVEKLE
jgi:uncharacterized membrane protein HdeD (DUF308 family)